MEVRGVSLTRFNYTKQDFVERVCRPGLRDDDDDERITPTSFDTTLKAGWAERMQRGGVFRYPLGELRTRILPGPSRFVAQLNIQRGLERRKPQEILSIGQNYDPKQFNFNNINPEEILFEMRKLNGGEHGDQVNHQDQVNGDGELSRMLVVVNVSPLEFGHCLFVPEPARRLPQVLNPFTVSTGMECVLLSSDPGFRVGFNSLGAFASVNHLHLHGYYLDHELQLERAPAQPLIPQKGFYRLTDFPVAFLFYAEVDDVERVSRDICRVTDLLVEGNRAHNLFFTRGCAPGREEDARDRQARSRRGVRVVIWPRVSCFGAKEESAFNVALCELAGHLPFKNKQDYDNSTEDDVKAVIRRYLLPEEEFLLLERQLVVRLQKDV